LNFQQSREAVTLIASGALQRYISRLKELAMTKIAQATAVFLVVSLLAASGIAMPPGDGMRPGGANAKGVELAGKISDDAKSFLADDGNQWSISNAAAVRGREGRNVVVRCRMDLAKRALYVLGIRQEQAESKQAVRYGDAAFRR
jgi:hypothetical protein